MIICTFNVFFRLETIIIPCINSTSSFLKAQGALLLGSAASNNQKVQIAALQANVIPLLLKHISDEYEFSVSVIEYNNKYLMLINLNLCLQFLLRSKKIVSMHYHQLQDDFLKLKNRL